MRNRISIKKILFYKAEAIIPSYCVPHKVVEGKYYTKFISSIFGGKGVDFQYSIFCLLAEEGFAIETITLLSTFYKSSRTKFLNSGKDRQVILGYLERMMREGPAKAASP